MTHWEPLFSTKMLETTLASAGGNDPAHDISHFHRVVTTAKRLCLAEAASLEIVVPAAWLHDFVIIPKNDPRRSQASRISADSACDYLRSIDYPAVFLPDISHAIEAHSFSAEIAPRTLEARIVQDADRLDALGAIGLARCFVTAGLMKTSLYSGDDPFCESRPPDDKHFTIDHFYKKLFRIAETLQTEAGRAEGARRVAIMKNYLSDLRLEI
jgi:uncharacterized protein